MKLKTRTFCIGLLTILSAPTAWAQTTIYGLGGGLFHTDTMEYVNHYTVVGGGGPYPLDFDASATILWALSGGSPVLYGTYDLSTGNWTSHGNCIGIFSNPCGLTSAPDGTWYATEYASFPDRTGLYVGSSAMPGSFSYVGVICSGSMTDIAADASGNLYGYKQADDSLYSIDPTTGVGTLIGPSGLTTTGSMSMDFDCSTNTLYATFNPSAGGSIFAAIDTATGLATQLEDTSSLGGARIIACKSDGTPGDPGVGYCFGDPGSGTPCPCNNDNDGSIPGSGCENGAFASGAQLTGSGVARVTSDSLVLTTTHLDPSNTGLYFQGNNQVSAGNGNPFGDGLRCAGGGLIRLQVRSANASGTSSTTIAIGTKGGVAPGDTKRYQCWYRDNSGSQPCGVGVNDFNLSNGYQVVWLP